MSGGIASTEKQAELLKDRGNFCFKKEKLSAAIEAYTEAISLCPDVPVYWTNRALCHKRRNDWDLVEADCRKALELDKKSVKANYMLGLALLEREHFEAAVKQLERALELSRSWDPTSYMVEEIWQEVAKARYKEWEQVSTPRLQNQKKLREVCENALQAAYKKVLSNIKSSQGSNIIYGDYIDLEGEDEHDNKVFMEISKITYTYEEQMRTLADVFEKAMKKDIPVEIPDYLCCKITMDIFRDPVITPSGITYERAVLMQHLNEVGKFDPLTRIPLQPDQLVPNLAIKEAVWAYLSENGWAYKCS